MKTIPLEEALKLTGSIQPLNIYQDGTCSAAWLVISPEHPDETNTLEVHTESFAINPHNNASTIDEVPEDFIDRENAHEIKANAALLAHFYNHGPEAIEALRECLAAMTFCRPIVKTASGTFLSDLDNASRKALALIAKASTVQMP